MTDAPVPTGEGDAGFRPPEFGSGDALLVVDVQNDFCAGGALEVPGAEEIVPALNACIERARSRSVPVFASRDNHPPDHVSFAHRGGPWPEHCVRGTAGAAFHPALDLGDDAVVISKGEDPDRDQYSAFDGTDLADRLRELGVERVWVGGLAEDVCVRATALDAAHAGFETHVLLGATRAVTPEGHRETVEEMRDAGVLLEDGP